LRIYVLVLIGLATAGIVGIAGAVTAGAVTGPAIPAVFAATTSTTSKTTTTTPTKGAEALTFKVTTTDDLVDSKLGDGKCAAANGKCSLRAAFNEVSAMKSKGQPVLIVVPKGDYDLTIDPPAAANLDEFGGDLDLVAHDTAPPLVTIEGDGAGDTVISQLKGDRVLELSAPEAVVIQKVTLQGGSSTNQGGGIANSEVGGLTLQDSEVTGNASDQGGGIYSRRPLNISNSEIVDNRATGQGGGVAMNTFGGQIDHSTVRGNTAGQYGGGVWIQNVDLAQIKRSFIGGNAVVPAASGGLTPLGGGIEIDSDPRFGATTIQVSYTTIQGNISAGAGGGIFWQATGTLALDSSLVALNTAETGGGISTGLGPSQAAIGTVQLTNTTLSGNQAERGGGIERSAGNTLLRAVTMAGNTALRGSGILFNGARAIYSVATGLIMANVPASQNCALSTGSGAFGANDRLSTPGANLESGQGCHLQSSDLSNTNPLLAPLANNGGPTQTRALLPGSPAVDRYTGADCPSTDQRAYKRAAGAACDIGSFEQASVRDVQVDPPPRALATVIGGTLTLIPSGAAPKTLRGLDYRPCTGKRHLNEAVVGGFYESPEARVSARGMFSFRHDKTHTVRFGNVFLILDGAVGHVYASISPASGALPLFDVTGVRYGEEIASGRLFMSAVGARLLNRLLRTQVFQSGLGCGRFSLHARALKEPKKPPKPGGTTTGKTSTTPTTTAPPPCCHLSAVVEPSNGGKVTSKPDGIICPGDCSEPYPKDSVITVKAEAAAGYVFDRWDGSCAGTDPNVCTVTIDMDRSVTAKFKKK
jgi:uncharacterized repeat protein (TIGR02543 family)